MTILKNNFLIKICIIFFWIIIIFLFLLIPHFKKSFQANAINIMTWGDMISLKTIAKFEKETGIKINVNYYETNEELFAKLHLTKAFDYDLITVADNGIEFLNKNEIIKKIDKTKLKFFNDIDEHFYNLYFDPNYQYSIPYYWDVYGLGINKKLFGEVKEKSWALVFDEKYITKKISMTDIPNDAILIAAQYLHQDTQNFNKEKLNQIEALLLKQKKLVEIYTDLRNEYILKYICPVVVTQSAYIYNVIKDDEDLEFIIPKEGGFLIVDLFVIPKLSKKDEIIYKFLNFLYEENRMKIHSRKYGYLPVIKKALYSLNLNYIGGLNKIFSPEQFSKFSFLSGNLNAEDVTQIWTRVKA